MPIVTTQETSDLRRPGYSPHPTQQTEVDGKGGIGYRNGDEEFFGRITKLATTERVFQGYLAAPTECANSLQFALISSQP
jgi:hypothetical protein